MKTQFNPQTIKIVGLLMLVLMMLVSATTTFAQSGDRDKDGIG